MKVYIRWTEDARTHLLCDNASLAEATELARMVADCGAYVPAGDVVMDDVTTQFLVDVDGKTGFEIIVGVA